MTKNRVLSLILSGVPAITFFAGSAAGADLNHLLRGDYAASGATACLYSAGGFDADLTPANPPAPFPFVNSFNTHAVRTFNGDGTGKVTARSVSFGHPFALPNPVPPHFFNRGGASSSDLQADFTYQVAPDRTSFTISQPLVTGTVLTGTRAGQTFAFGPVSLVGNISHDRKTLTTASDAPVIDTLTFSNGDVFQRICHQSRTLIKLKNDN